MSNVALKRSISPSTVEVGTVETVEHGEITVHTDGDSWHAERAASCLVEPQVGDEVTIVITGDGRAFVVAVLVRACVGETTLAVDGDLRIAARGGTCYIEAARDVELRSEGAMSLLSKALNLRAEEGNVVLGKLTMLASSIVAHSDSARFAAKALDSFYERVAQTAKVWHRKVEELDLLRAGRADYRTDKEMCLRSENFLVGARKLAKLDAEQIHIG
jgi:hypothetical protein